MAVNIFSVCAINLATDGDRQPNCILVKIFFLPFTRRLTAERDAGFFFFLRFSKLKKKKGRGREGEVTRIRHATRNLPSSRFLLLRLSP